MRRKIKTGVSQDTMMDHGTQPFYHTFLKIMERAGLTMRAEVTKQTILEVTIIAA